VTNFKYANNPQTTLAGAITVGDTSLSVASGSAFPATGQFTIIVGAEIMLVTGVAGTIWTVQRGYDGTAAAAHNQNAIVTGILTRASFLNALYFDVRAYGAVGDSVTDDTDAIQAAITDAFNAGGGTVVLPPGDYKVSSTLQTPLDVSGSLKLMGTGRPKGLISGHSGDPSASQGATLTYTGMTGDIFLAELTSGNKRQYLTFENLSFLGNSDGTSGHGLHFKATAVGSVGILPTLRDVTVNGCKQHGIYYEGNVFESQLLNVRSSQNGEAGFKAESVDQGIPGETRFYGCTFNVNNRGVDISGGGQFSFHGLTATQNTNEGLLATAVGLSGVDFNFELNGGTGLLGRQVALDSVTGAILTGIAMQVTPGATGKGIQLINCLWVHIVRFGTNYTAGGSGWVDFFFEDTSNRCIVDGYSPDNFGGAYTLGSGGGHVVRQGGAWLTNQTHSQQSLTGGVTHTFDARRADSFLSQTTVESTTVTIDIPTISTNFHHGQRVTVHCFNNTAGTASWSWHSIWHLAGAWVNPAAGKTRTIMFEYDGTRAGFYEVARSAADIT